MAAVFALIMIPALAAVAAFLGGGSASPSTAFAMAIFTALAVFVLVVALRIVDGAEHEAAE